MVVFLSGDCLRGDCLQKIQRIGTKDKSSLCASLRLFLDLDIGVILQYNVSRGGAGMPENTAPPAVPEKRPDLTASYP
jgi:hypothetical protein